MVAVVGAETVDEEAVGVIVTCTSTKVMLASRDTTKTRGMVHMVEAGITGEGDTANPQTTTPQLSPITAHTEEGIRHIPIIRITNRVGTGVHLSHHMIRVLHINSRPTEVVEEDIVLDMMVRMARRMGTLEGEEARLPIEGEVRRTVAVGMAIEEAREGGTDMVADTTIPRRTVVTAEVVTAEVVEVITLVGAINLVGVINLAVVISLVEVISPADRIAPASSLMEAEEATTREVEVAGEDTNHKEQTPASGLLHPYFFLPLSSQLLGRSLTCVLECTYYIYYIPEHHL